MPHFNIQLKAERLLVYILNATDKSPKKIRLDIVPEIRKCCLTLLSDIINANMLPIHTERRTELQKDCLIQLRLLDSLCDVARTLNYLTLNQVSFITMQTKEIFDSINCWIASDQNRS